MERVQVPEIVVLTLHCRGFDSNSVSVEVETQKEGNLIRGLCCMCCNTGMKKKNTTTVDLVKEEKKERKVLCFYIRISSKKQKFMWEKKKI